jgi:hypothetical protein
MLANPQTKYLLTHHPQTHITCKQYAARVVLNYWLEGKKKGK